MKNKLFLFNMSCYKFSNFPFFYKFVSTRNFDFVSCVAFEALVSCGLPVGAKKWGDSNIRFFVSYMYLSE